jgi:ATP-dependent DNA helicase RecG
MHLSSSIDELKRTTRPTLKELKKLGLLTIKDLLLYFPFRYEDFSHMAKIAEIKPGEMVSIKGRVVEIKAIHGFRGKVIPRSEAIVSDESGSIKVIWFNQTYLAKSLHVGNEIFLSGVATLFKSLQLVNPIYEKFNETKDTIHTARIIPIYHLTAGLPLRTLRSAVYQALDAVDELEETLPKEIIKEYKLMDLREAITNLHFPETSEKLEQARQRYAFEEIFDTQLGVQKHKYELLKAHSFPIPFNQKLIKDFISKLPFELTPNQKLAAWDILQDMERKVPMNRLLEGDVGSGKTVIALTAALQASSEGFQSAIICPTEILAFQHYSNLLSTFEDFHNISLVLLTSKNAALNGTAVPKKELLEEIAHGGPQVIVSTHALLQKTVEFKELALVIVDEQHRFGVKQRAALKNKTDKYTPHFLTMSATPIPRTLKLSLYGDLDISVLAKKPHGRKPVKTTLVDQAHRNDAYAFIRKQIQEGRQAFVVTPLIEGNELSSSKAAISEQKKLKEIFKEFGVELLHGKMKAADKEVAMQSFLENRTQILVCTSVIEVGVDVPNASVMIIEGAERFGLAQLHQFRGRVGRASHQSHCFLFTESQNEEAIERLQKFTTITDGFELAELDLENRGFGSLFGADQSGFKYFRYFHPVKDKKMAQQARLWAEKIIQKDPELKTLPYWQERIKDRVVHLE